MKKIFLICLGLLVTFLLFGDEGISGEDQIAENISKLLEGLEHLPEAGLEETRGFIQVLVDSILLTAVQAGIPHNIQSEIKENLDVYKRTENLILQENAIESLWKAARILDPEFDLLIPEKANIENIKEDTRLELHKAQSFQNQGKTREVLYILLRTVLRVVTPVGH